MAACAASDDETPSGSSGNGCPVGSETCPCTQGGACDPGLVCLSNLCVDPDGAGGSGAGPGGGGAPSGPGSGGQNPVSSSSTGGRGECFSDGCKAIDVLFAMDGSGSMQEEVSALAASQAFTGIIDALAGINCGDIQFRIGVTHDNDGGFIVPTGWAGAVPWFDSDTMSTDEIAVAFNGAAGKINGGSGTEVGCEHVLTSAAGLLGSDTSGFLRDDALLVLVLLTDVDDYGAYDNIAGNDCGIGCSTIGAPVQQIYDQLVALKGGDEKALGTIVVAGDPNSPNGGENICGQPGSCGCNGVDCGVFHATRLWAFADLHPGSNGYKSNLCAGAQVVPNVVTDALSSNIDLACKDFVPK